MLALTIYRDGLCRCGQPIAIAHDDEHDGSYDVKTVLCHACAAVETTTRADSYKPEPGSRLYPVFIEPELD